MKVPIWIISVISKAGNQQFRIGSVIAFNSLFHLMQSCSWKLWPIQGTAGNLSGATFGALHCMGQRPGR